MKDNVLCLSDSAECLSAARKIDAAFSTEMEERICFSHSLFRRGTQNSSAAVNISMANSNEIWTSSVYMYSSKLIKTAWRIF